MLKKITLVLIGIFLLPALNVFAMDLTGRWNCNDGGKYYIRQLGNEIWWFGENSPTAPSWSNVANGKIYGNTLRLKWSDVPKGSIMNSGILVLDIISSSKMVAREKTGGFGGSEWSREGATVKSGRIDSFTWIGKDSDKVGEWGNGRPDGRFDGHFKLKLSLPDRIGISSIAVYSSTDAGTPAGGQVWHSQKGSYWMLGVFQHGRQLNQSHISSLGVYGGAVIFDLYCNDSGWFKNGQSFLVEVEFANGGKASRVIKLGVLQTTPVIPSGRDYTSQQRSDFEWDTDRMGSDYNNFDLSAADPQLCKDACENDQACKAWTYVKPNTIQGPNPRCWLKYAVPSPTKSSCCVSGVVRGASKLQKNEERIKGIFKGVFDQ